eukprot:9479833-Pyramimonas_sp.AAC.1
MAAGRPSASEMRGNPPGGTIEMRGIPPERSRRIRDGAHQAAEQDVSGGRRKFDPHRRGLEDQYNGREREPQIRPGC